MGCRRCATSRRSPPQLLQGIGGGRGAAVGEAGRRHRALQASSGFFVLFFSTVRVELRRAQGGQVNERSTTALGVAVSGDRRRLRQHEQDRARGGDRRRSRGRRGRPHRPQDRLHRPGRHHRRGGRRSGGRADRPQDGPAGRAAHEGPARCPGIPRRRRHRGDLSSRGSCSRSTPPTCRARDART